MLLSTYGAAFGCLLILSSRPNCAKLCSCRDTAGNNKTHRISLSLLRVQRSRQGRLPDVQSLFSARITKMIVIASRHFRFQPCPLFLSTLLPFLHLHHNSTPLPTTNKSYEVNVQTFLHELPVFRAKTMPRYSSVKDLMRICFYFSSLFSGGH